MKGLTVGDSAEIHIRIPGDKRPKLVQVFDEDRKGDIMTIADELRREGEIRGEIKIYRELMESGLIPRELAEQKIAELSGKLRAVTAEAHMLPADGFGTPDRIPA